MRVLMPIGVCPENATRQAGGTNNYSTHNFWYVLSLTFGKPWVQAGN
jgi:hypothetical protein